MGSLRNLAAEYIGNDNPDSKKLHLKTSTDGRCQLEEIEKPVYFLKGELMKAFDEGFEPCEICCDLLEHILYLKWVIFRYHSRE